MTGTVKIEELKGNLKRMIAFKKGRISVPIKRLLKAYTPKWIKKMRWAIIKPRKIYLRGYFASREEAAKSMKNKPDIYSAANEIGLAGTLTMSNEKVLSDNEIFLLHYIMRFNTQLTVVDFGGSFGRAYKSIRNCAEGMINKIDYIVIERDDLVPILKEAEINKDVRYMTIREYERSDIVPNIVYCSSSLQYLEDAFGIIKQLVSKGPEYLLVANTPITRTSESYYVVQGYNKGESIYRIFNKAEFDKTMSRLNYDLEVSYCAGSNYKKYFRDVSEEKMLQFTMNCVYKKRQGQAK